MDQNLMSVIEKRIEKTIKSLRENQMEGYYAKTSEDVVKLVEQLCKEGETVTVGGSMSLFESGVIEHLSSGRYEYLDRNAKDADVQKIYRDAFFCDTYITSCNAITEAGELYNVDGNGNRVAAITFGPKSVIIVAGYNKLVADLDEACERVRSLAAPANTQRLGCNTPCKTVGACCDCHSHDRICCSYNVIGFQRNKERIKVILVGEPLGY